MLILPWKDKSSVISNILLDRIKDNSIILDLRMMLKLLDLKFPMLEITVKRKHYFLFKPTPKIKIPKEYQEKEAKKIKN